jgi:hypothetical protein
MQTGLLLSLRRYSAEIVANRTLAPIRVQMSGEFFVPNREKPSSYVLISKEG